MQGWPYLARRNIRIGKSLSLPRSSRECGFKHYRSKEGDQFEKAFEATRRERAKALIVLPHPITNYHREQIVSLAAKGRLPAMYGLSAYVTVGGLMSYGPSLSALHRRAAYYVDRILKGTKPAELPVEQPMKFEFVINLKAAKQIGLTIPPNVLARADRVIR